jgi:hypothetical protein
MPAPYLKAHIFIDNHIGLPLVPQAILSLWRVASKFAQILL